MVATAPFSEPLTALLPAWSVHPPATAVSPLSFTTCLTSVSDGALSLLTKVQVTVSPRLTVTEVTWVVPLSEQVSDVRVYPAAPADSDRLYVPAVLVASNPLSEPATELLPALSVQALAAAVPPLSLTKCLTSVSDGALSLLM